MAEETLSLPYATRDAAWDEKLEKRASNLLSSMGIPADASFTEELGECLWAPSAASKLNQTQPHTTSSEWRRRWKAG